MFVPDDTEVQHGTRKRGISYQLVDPPTRSIDLYIRTCVSKQPRQDPLEGLLTLKISSSHGKSKAAGGIHACPLITNPNSNRSKGCETQRQSHQKWCQLRTHDLTLAWIEANPKADEATNSEQLSNESRRGTNSKMKVITDSIRYA